MMIYYIRGRNKRGTKMARFPRIHDDDMVDAVKHYSNADKKSLVNTLKIYMETEWNFRELMTYDGEELENMLQSYQLDKKIAEAVELLQDHGYTVIPPKRK